MSKVIFPGSFDPFHMGHLELVLDASKIFEEVIVIVSNNPSKVNSYWFTLEERKHLIEKCISKLNNVKVVIGGNQEIADLCHKYQIFNVWRGVKSGRTLDDEVRLQVVTNYMSNLKYQEKIKFIYTVSSGADFRGSSIVKAYASSKEAIKDLVPKEIIYDIIKRYQERVNNYA